MNNCADCGKEYPEPTHDNCPRGHTLTIQRHYCGQGRGRMGYCKDCYATSRRGQHSWNEDDQQWRATGDGRRHYTCEECGVKRGYNRNPKPTLCRKCKNAAKSKSVDYPECEWCGTTYQRQLIKRRNRQMQRYCCHYCASRASQYTREQRQAAALKSQGDTKPKRRRKETREARIARAFKQGYKCWHCKKLIDLSRKGPHPLSLSTDHIVPVSHGGTDDEANLVSVHHRCNSKRGATGPIQLGFDKPGVEA